MITLHRRIQCLQSYLQQRKLLLLFDSVPNPRGRRGRRWQLGSLLSAALLTMALLARSLRRAEQLTADLSSSRLFRRLGIRRRVPDSTLGDALAEVPPQALLDRLHHQVRTEHRRKSLVPTRLPVGVLALDGKAREVRDEAQTPFYCQQQNAEGSPPHYIYRVRGATLISSAAAVCVHQKPIPAWTNEMGYAREFFHELCQAYSRLSLFEIVTSDAGVLSREHCGELDARGFGYVVALKGNNPDLEREARQLFEPIVLEQRPVAEDDGWEPDSSRGWIKRQLWTSTELAGWPGWEHLRQLWLVRVLGCDGKDGPVRVIEERLYVTNLPVAHRVRGNVNLTLVRAPVRATRPCRRRPLRELSLSLVLAVARTIENELHGTLDIQLREDDGNWVRRGYGLINTGLLRAMAYNLLAIARSVHLRAERLVPWQQLRDWLRDAIIWPVWLAGGCPVAPEVGSVVPS